MERGLDPTEAVGLVPVVVEESSRTRGFSDVCHRQADRELIKSFPHFPLAKRKFPSLIAQAEIDSPAGYLYILLLKRCSLKSIDLKFALTVTCLYLSILLKKTRFCAKCIYEYLKNGSAYSTQKCMKITRRFTTEKATLLFSFYK